MDRLADVPVFGEPFIDVFVLGDPVTQGSLSRGANGNVYNEHWEELMWWRNRIELAVRKNRGRDAKECVEGPVVMSVSVYVDRGRHPAWRAFPIGREAGGTDLAKLVRAIEDGFSRTTFHVKTGRAKGQKQVRGAEAISDDGNIVATHSAKFFTDPVHPDPGCRWRVWRVDRVAERAGWVPVPSWPSWRYIHRTSM